MTTTPESVDAALADALPAAAPVPASPPVRTTPGTQLARVRTRDLQPDPNNPRDEVTDVQALADSIRQVGLLQPIIARRAADGTHLVVVCGHRRLAAIKALGWADVDVVVRREMLPDQVLVAMLAENGQRVALDPIEEARAFNRLKVVYRLSDSGVAERVGRTQVYVSGRLALLALTPQEQEEIRAGQRTIVESIARGRVRSGRVRPPRTSTRWHLGSDHPLASKARARCRRLNHPAGNRLTAVAYGDCWESVIHADQTKQLHDHSATSGQCALCGAPVTVDGVEVEQPAGGAA
ncbi:ParB/RepB/Spo0J family partition protein [Cellulomonas sp. P4]|uniref:ParB/RepB/Spo0J family partition protein n=1 Tax=Cellulomonas sp. P4 TaxID=3142533 RepID=UPI0031BA3FF7